MKISESWKGREMNFAEAMKTKGSFTRTENGAVALNTTGDKLLDFYATVGSLRNADELRVQSLFEEAYKEDALLATKTAFFSRDIRSGLGERKTFRRLIRYMAEYHPEALRPNLDLIGVYGRYDDLYSSNGVPIKEYKSSYLPYTPIKSRFGLKASG